MSLRNVITAAFLDSILRFLAPLFLASTGGDLCSAKAAAQSVLDSYEPRTNREVRMVALSIAFSLGALDSVSRSYAPGLHDLQVTRWRANANALSRSATQSEIRYDKLRNASPAPAIEKAEPAPEKTPSLPAGTSPDDLLAFVKSAAASLINGVPANPPAPPQHQPIPLSRQQRRRMEQAANKKHQRQEELARRAARLAAHRNGGPMPAAATG